MRVESWEKVGKSRKVGDIDERFSCKMPAFRGEEVNKVCLSGSRFPV